MMSTHYRPGRLLAGALLAAVCVATPLRAAITNGDFETGDLTGWSTFLTTFGELDTASVAIFDTDGDSVATNSAELEAGSTQPPSVEGGGGITQTVTMVAGTVELTADIAATSHQPNADFGFFELLFDGNPVDSHDFENGSAGITERATLSYSGVITAGPHDIGIRVTRPYGALPFQYIDNVVLTQQPIPEPSALALLGLALVGTICRRRRG